MTSLVILIFFAQPSSNSSSVHSSSLSIGGGFFLTVDWEKTMGVVLCLLVFLSREEELDMWMWVLEVPLLFLVLEKPSEKSVSSELVLWLVP